MEQIYNLTFTQYLGIFAMIYGGARIVFHILLIRRNKRNYKAQIKIKPRSIRTKMLDYIGLPLSCYKVFVDKNPKRTKRFLTQAFGATKTNYPPLAIVLIILNYRIKK